METKVFSVSEINQYLANYLDKDPILNYITLSGEVGNISPSKSGHLYFNLKDQDSLISIIVWKSVVEKLSAEEKSQLKEGAKLLISGSIKIYERGGSYNLTASKIEFKGNGNLYQQFLTLKNELQKLGIFDASNKKPIKRFNYNVGLITSKHGAVLQDIKSTILRRFPNLILSVYDVPVQGINAATEIIAKLKIADKKQFDVIILARGGGSIEDLWAFNSELLALEIYNSQTPIISAIGHETDFTIADFVSDLRAPTPTAAAEMLNPNLIDVKQELFQLQKHLFLVSERLLERKKHDLYFFEKKLLNSLTIINNYQTQVSKLEKFFLIKAQQFIKVQRMNLYNLSTKLINLINQNLKTSSNNLQFYQNKLSYDKIKIIISHLGGQIQKEKNTFLNLMVYKISWYSQIIKNTSFDLIIKTKRLLELKKIQLENYENQLNHLNPNFLLDKGYIYMIKNHQIVNTIFDLQKNESIELRFKDGIVISKIEEIIKK